MKILVKERSLQAATATVLCSHRIASSICCGPTAFSEARLRTTERLLKPRLAYNFATDGSSFPRLGILMAKLRPAAFMSYVRFVDDYEEGRLSHFRQKLSAELKLQTGEDFEIFQDRNDILWGQNWKSRIEEGIDSSTFLLCVLTPGFFKSPACRAEFDRFVKREKERNRNDLILAVYYVDCPQLVNKSLRNRDSMAKVLSERQYTDWRKMRFEPATSGDYGKAIAKIASEIVGSLGRKRSAAKGKGPKSKMKAKTGIAAQAVVNIATPPAILQPTISEAAPPARTEPVTRTVDATGLGQHTSVSEAIAAANPGERILIRPGIYKEELIVDKPLELVGDGEVEKIQIVSSSGTTLEFRTTIGRVSNLSVIFDGTAKDLEAVKISQGRLILEKCVISVSNGYATFIGGGASPQILDNRIASRKHGILGTGSRFIIEHNDIVLREGGVGVFLIATEDAAVRANHIQGGVVGVNASSRVLKNLD